MPPDNYLTVTLRRNTVEAVRLHLLRSLAPKISGAVANRDGSDYLRFRPSVAGFVETAVRKELERLDAANLVSVSEQKVADGGGS